MLNYRHIFHAGNFADVFKHIVIIALIGALKCKEAPFCYFDTHADAGRYDLASISAQKNREYAQGIGRLWKIREAPPEVQDYLSIIRAFHGEELSGKRVPPHYFPGSPRLVRALLRPQGRMVLTELHPTDFLALKAEFSHDRQVIVCHQDDYRGLKFFCPPRNGGG